MSHPIISELPQTSPGKTGWPWTEESPQLPDTLPDGKPWPRRGLFGETFLEIVAEITQ